MGYSEASPQRLRSQDLDPQGKGGFRTEIWRVEGVEGAEVVCPRLGVLELPSSGDVHRQTWEGFPGTVSSQDHVGFRSSSSQTSVFIPPLSRLVPDPNLKGSRWHCHGWGSLASRQAPALTNP